MEGHNSIAGTLKEITKHVITHKTHTLICMCTKLQYTYVPIGGGLGVDLGLLLDGSKGDLVLSLFDDVIRTLDERRTLFSMGEDFTTTTADEDGEREGEREGDGEGGRVVGVFVINVVISPGKGKVNVCLEFWREDYKEREIKKGKRGRKREMRWRSIIQDNT